jgi:DNA-directed RNA polymerase subunit RPC12/RpoP
MDLEIDIECRHCGHEFTLGFSMMRHGMALRCPFCASFSLNLSFDELVETPGQAGAFERPGELRIESKVKT